MDNSETTPTERSNQYRYIPNIASLHTTLNAAEDTITETLTSTTQEATGAVYQLWEQLLNGVTPDDTSIRQAVDQFLGVTDAGVRQIRLQDTVTQIQEDLHILLKTITQAKTLANVYQGILNMIELIDKGIISEEKSQPIQEWILAKMYALLENDEGVKLSTEIPFPNIEQNILLGLGMTDEEVNIESPITEPEVTPIQQERTCNETWTIVEERPTKGKEPASLRFAINGQEFTIIGNSLASSIAYFLKTQNQEGIPAKEVAEQLFKSQIEAAHETYKHETAKLKKNDPQYKQKCQSIERKLAHTLKKCMTSTLHSRIFYLKSKLKEQTKGEVTIINTVPTNPPHAFPARYKVVLVDHSHRVE